ncbi:MAG: OmpA family protein [Burkholderiales bacterium]|jgi:OOP family OmpA-OmpF porin|nr:OmpA family protein [Burkholderiales bacterium]
MLDEQDRETGLVLGFVIAIAIALVLAITLFAAIGVPAMKAKGKPPAAAAASQLSAVYANGQLTLSGSVADEATRNRIAQAAKLVFGDKVVDQLTVGATGLKLDVKGRVIDLFARLKQLAAFKLSLLGGSAAVEGVAASDAAKSAIEQFLATFFSDATKIAANISVSGAALAVRYNPAALFQEQIEFATNSAEIPEAAKPRLMLAAALLKDDGRKVRVVGYTDNTGDASINNPLSAERAASVVKYLEAQGVPAGQLAAEGKGDADPIADNATPEGRAHNRRVEFVPL